jgi:hypothetical protein
MNCEQLECTSVVRRLLVIVVGRGLNNDIVERKAFFSSRKDSNGRGLRLRGAPHPMREHQN